LFLDRTEGATFAAAGGTYWLDVFPEARRQRERWRRRAEEIPDPSLRGDALHTIEEKWGHSEGAAAFAVLLPRKARKPYIRMAIAYELMIDYLDTLSERPVSDPWANTIQLHGAARNALAVAPRREPDYYMFHSHSSDGGFLSEQVQTCRELFLGLPSSSLVSAQTEQLVSLYAEAQAHCHVKQTGAVSSGPTTRIDATAARYPHLSWEEICAACNTSIPLLALMTLAVQPGCQQSQVEAWRSAYFPWTASLHILLHSLVDEAGDRAGGRYNQFGHYSSRQEAARALGEIATRARERIALLPEPEKHLTLLSGMVGYYLAEPPAWRGDNRLIAESVLAAIGPAATWAMHVHRARQRVSSRR
jgi:tetraprenyl-beta-curcumene synthase